MRPEEDAFIEKLYQDTFRLLWVYAMSKLNNPALAQEVVQDAFLEAVKNIDRVGLCAPWEIASYHRAQGAAIRP